MTHNGDIDEIEDIDCTEAIDRLYAYLDGEIRDPESISKLEHHLKHCESCFTRKQLETALTLRMKEDVRTQTPESLQKRLRDMIKKL
jgi:anti-sigma factor (TIGR02949 family)